MAASGDNMPEKQKCIIDKIQKDALKSTNMSDAEAYEFAFRCWQLRYIKKVPKTHRNTNKEAWDHGTFEEFYKKLKSGILRHVDHYTGYIGYLDSSNYELYDGPTVLGDGTNSSTVYDVVYLSGTSAILCMHNCSIDYQTWSEAKSAVSSYRSGGYLPSLVQVTTWYTGISKT